MATPSITPNQHITLHYLLFDESGEVADQASAEEPLTYVHGYHQIMPGLEQALEGKSAGDNFEVTLSAEESFGPYDEQGVFEVERERFPEGAEIEVGDSFVAEGVDGDQIPMRVLEIHDASLVVDTNHPLAGQKVRLEVNVQAVRKATAEEIESAKAELEHGDACGCEVHGPSSRPPQELH